MDGTIISQGSFVVPAAGPSSVNIVIPSGVDWMRVFNYTQAGANPGGGAVNGVNFYWQLGMAAGTGIVQYKTNAGAAALEEDTLLSGGFTLLNTALTFPGPSFAITAITNANPPVVSSATTPAVGSIVRILNANNQPGISGLDFTVTAVNPGVTFTIGNINLANTVASTAGQWRQIPFDPIFYPRRRYITYMANRGLVGSTIVYLSVTHQFAVGQIVRFDFGGNSNPNVWGAYGVLDGIQGTIVAVNSARAGNEPNNAGTANNVTVNVDTSAFPAWNTINAAFPNTNTGNNAYPAGATYVPFTPAQLVPVGEDSAVSLASPLAQTPLNYDGSAVIGAQTGLLSDSTVNTAFIGMTLGTGGNGNALGAAITGPAGTAAADVIYWLAGKSTLGGS